MKNGWQKLFAALGLTLLMLIVAWSAFQSISDAAMRAHWFELTGDEALHAEVISVLSQTGRYEDWSGTRFVPQLTTGPAIVLPAALISWAGRVNPSAVGRAVVILYHLALLIVVGLLAVEAVGDRGANRKVWIAGLAAGFFHMGWRGLQDTNYYLFGVLGEGPLAFYMGLALLLLLKDHRLGAGICASLTVLCKPYMVFFPAALLLSGLIEFMHERRPRDFSRLLLGLALPWFVWMGWMAVVLGPINMIQFWIEYPRLMRGVNGGGLPNASALANQGWSGLFSQHLKAFIEFTRGRSIFIALLGYAYFFKMGRLSLSGKVFGLFVVLHMSWWFMISPGAEARYLYPGLVAGWLGFILALFSFSAPKLRSIQVNLGWLPEAALVLTFFYFGYRVSLEWKKNNSDLASCTFCRQLEMQDFWKKSANTPKPRLWATSTSYASDRDRVLSAPFSLSVFNPSEAKTPLEGWVVVGHIPKPGTQELLKARNCSAVLSFPGSAEGFWKCP